MLQPYVIKTTNDLEWFNDEDSGEERDEERGQPLVGLVVAEHDPVRPEEKDGNANCGNAKGPSNKDAITEHEFNQNVKLLQQMDRIFGLCANNPKRIVI